MVGVFFFDLFSHSGLRAFFTSDFANCTTNYAPTIRCCSQHLMVGVILFWPVLPFWTAQLHQVLFTASDGWGYFFLTCSPILDLGHFSQVILPIVLLIMPQPSGAVHSIDGWGYFFFDLFSHSGLRPFFTSDFANCTTNYMPQPSGAVHSIWWLGLFFFLTCSPILDLGHFSQVILPIVLQIMPQVSGAVHSIWWLGLFFFWPVLPFWT